MGFGCSAAKNFKLTTLVIKLQLLLRYIVSYVQHTLISLNYEVLWAPRMNKQGDENPSLPALRERPHPSVRLSRRPALSAAQSHVSGSSSQAFPCVGTNSKEQTEVHLCVSHQLRPLFLCPLAGN